MGRRILRMHTARTEGYQYWGINTRPRKCPSFTDTRTMVGARPRPNREDVVEKRNLAALPERLDPPILYCMTFVLD